MQEKENFVLEVGDLTVVGKDQKVNKVLGGWIARGIDLFGRKAADEEAEGGAREGLG